MSSKPAPPRPIDITAALAAPKPCIDFVVPGLPVGAVASIVGSGGVGKSYFALQVAVAVAAGHTWVYDLLQGPGQPAKKPAPAKVVLVLGEESREMTVLRLHQVVDHHASNAKERKTLLDRLAGNLSLYALAGGPRLLLDDYSEDAHGVEELASMCAGARLVILDPLRRFHIGEENDSLHMTNTVEVCERLGYRIRSATMVTHHTTKLSTVMATAERSAASRGSTALTDGVRLQVNLSALDSAMAKAYRIGDDRSARCVRVDVAKANYISDGHRGVLSRTHEGVLVPVPFPDGASLQMEVAPVKSQRTSRKSKNV